MVAQVYPAILIRNIEAHNGCMPFCQRMAMIFLDKVASQFLITKVLDIGVTFIIEDIRESFVEDERQNKIFELGSIGRSTNGTGGIPQPGF